MCSCVCVCVCWPSFFPHTHPLSVSVSGCSYQLCARLENIPHYILTFFDNSAIFDRVFGKWSLKPNVMETCVNIFAPLVILSTICERLKRSIKIDGSQPLSEMKFKVELYFSPLNERFELLFEEHITTAINSEFIWVFFQPIINLCNEKNVH